jgi:hypothetical protein
MIDRGELRTHIATPKAYAMDRQWALQSPHEPDCDRRPGRIGDDALATASTRRKQMQLAVLASDQPAEQEAPRRPRDQYVAV